MGLNRTTGRLSAAVFMTAAVSFGSFAAEGGSGTPRIDHTVGVVPRGAHFVPNQGQWDNRRIHFGFRAPGMDIAFRESSLTMVMRREKEKIPHGEHGDIESVGARGSRAVPGPGIRPNHTQRTSNNDEPVVYEALTLSVTFPDSNPVNPRGASPQSAKFNYYIGGDDSKWASDVPSFGVVIYRNLYDGIDLHVMGSESGVLKYEFHCAPGSDHTQIRVRYEGIDSLRIGGSGDLIIETAFGLLRDNAPLVWQERAGDDQSAACSATASRIGTDRIDLSARFEAVDDNTYTIALLEQSNPSLPLVIDPEIEWMTYLGGSGNDVGQAIAVDSEGDAVVAGWTNSLLFEGRNNSNHGGNDAFALKVRPSGSLIWMTYLGGSSTESGTGIAVDHADNILVTGVTTSVNFGGRNNSSHGFSDGFVVKVSPEGQLQWMTYVGGSDVDNGAGIAVNRAGDILATGRTTSTDFEGSNNSNHGEEDGFLVKVSASGDLQWMTYLGGTGDEVGADVAVDHLGDVLVTGATSSTDFEGRINSHSGEEDAFVVKVSAAGDLEWMRYIGGSHEDFGAGVAVDRSNHVLIVGETVSFDLERNGGSFRGATDAFLATISPSGELLRSIYLGGPDTDSAWDVAVDDRGSALVTGQTDSIHFEGRNNYNHGGVDAFVLSAEPLGGVQWMTFLGGTGSDFGRGIAMDASRNALVTGATDSNDFEGRVNGSNGPGNDAFIVKLDDLNAQTALLRTISIVTGQLLGGTVEDLVRSDDAYLHLRSGFGENVSDLHQMHIVINAFTFVDSPMAIDVVVESGIDQPSGVARLSLLNWTTGEFDEVAQYNIGLNEITIIVPDIDAADYINSFEYYAEIALSIRHVVFVPFLAFTFESFVDWVEIRVE